MSIAALQKLGVKGVESLQRDGQPLILNTPSSRRFLLMITTLLPSSVQGVGLREGQPSPSFPLKGVGFTDGSPLFKWGWSSDPLPTRGVVPNQWGER